MDSADDEDDEERFPATSGYRRRPRGKWDSSSSSSSNENGEDDTSEDTGTDEDVPNRPELVKEPLLRILLVGSSGSGKTTLARNILKRVCPRRKVYIVNGRRSDAESTPSNWISTSWSQVPNLRKAALLAEDLVQMDRDELGKLKEALNYSNHHRKLSPIIAICHQVNGHRIYSLLQQFHYIYLSARPGSLKSLKACLLELSYTKEERQRYAALLTSATSSQFNHLVIDVDNHRVSLTKIGEASPYEKALLESTKNSVGNRARMMAPKFLALLPHPEYAAAIFDLLIPCLDPKKLHPESLTYDIKMATSAQIAAGQKPKKQMNLKILDYIHALVNPDPNFVPDPHLLAIHDYLTSHRGFALPSCYIMSKSFLPQQRLQQHRQQVSPAIIPPQSPPPHKKKSENNNRRGGRRQRRPVESHW